MLFLINLDDCGRATHVDARAAWRPRAFLRADRHRFPAGDACPHRRLVRATLSRNRVRPRQRVQRRDRMLGVAPVRMAGAGCQRGRRRVHGARGRPGARPRVAGGDRRTGAACRHSTWCSSARRRATSRRAVACRRGLSTCTERSAPSTTPGATSCRAPGCGGSSPAAPWRIDRPIDHYTGGSRAGAVKPRVGGAASRRRQRGPELGVDSQIEPYTYRIDRARIVEAARRRIIASRVSALYYKLYEYL